MRRFPFHTALTMALLALLLAGARGGLTAHRPARWPAAWLTVNGPDLSQFTALVDFAPDSVPLLPLVRHVDATPAGLPLLPDRRNASAPQLLEDGDGVLDRFYGALWRTEKGLPGAVTQVLHYGDSPTTADLITGDIRALLQKRYGNGGHGFVLIAKPWAWYQHTGVDLSASGWQIFPATRFEARDGWYGLGGVSFTGDAGATSRIVFKDPRHTRFQVWFLRQPHGGAFSLEAEGVRLGQVDTAGPAPLAEVASFQTPAGASRLELRVEEGAVRVFGISAEAPGSGVVYDSLGLNGASIMVLTRRFNAAHWTSALTQREPNLVVINYGTNEADFAGFIDRQYEGELREAIRRVRAAVPKASILVMSPMDRGYRNGPSEIATMATIPQLVAIQRRVAKETGCGFFDTFDAMGGEGTMARWYNAQPRLVSADFIHPYPAGGKLIAEIFVREIGFGLNRFKLRQILVSSSK